MPAEGMAAALIAANVAVQWTLIEITVQQLVFAKGSWAL